MYFCVITPFSGVHVDALFLAYVPLVAIGGALIDFGIGLLIATISFWFIRIDSLRWVIMGLEQDFSRYPISIYGRGVRVLLAFILPFAFMNYLPATFLLHKAGTVVGTVWVLGAYLSWRSGINRFQGTGS